MFDHITKQIDKDLEIDSMDLDDESLRTPKLHTKYTTMLTRESTKLKRIMSEYDRYYLDRWKYYLGKQTDAYYEKHGYFHEKILKTDVDKYLKADKLLAKAQQMVKDQEELVSLIESTIKEINRRSFHIKNAVEWRKFCAGG